MKTIAVSANAKDIDASLETRFGRAQYFVLVDPDTMEWEGLDNELGLKAPRGAGIQTAQLMAQNRINTVITGNCGPKAFEVLKAVGINVIYEANGTVRQAIDKVKRGELSIAQQPNAPSHWR
jgi:predicted Fe-Mo cluster-binding NifX family protein